MGEPCGRSNQLITYFIVILLMCWSSEPLLFGRVLIHSLKCAATVFTQNIHDVIAYDAVKIKLLINHLRVIMAEEIPVFITIRHPKPALYPFIQFVPFLRCMMVE